MSSPAAAELAAAVAADAAWAAGDAAKKRAAAAGVSYEQFKARVACAQLKPLARADLASRAAPARGRGADATACAMASAAAASAAAAASPPPPPPSAFAASSGSAAFAAAWKALPAAPAARLAWLTQLGAPALRGIFTRQLDPELLVSIVAALAGALGGGGGGGGGGAAAASAAVAVALLDALAGTPRFELVARFLDSEDKRAVRLVVGAAAAAAEVGKEAVAGFDAAAGARVLRAYACAGDAPTSGPGLQSSTRG